MRNNIGPKGAKYLKELLLVNKFLVFVDVSGNVLCDQGIYQISLALKVNQTLQVLSLARNGITNFGIDFLREGLIENEASALKELDISQNAIGHKGLENLQNYLGDKRCDLRKLNVSECDINGKGAL